MARQSAQANVPLSSSTEQTFRLWQRAHSVVGSRQSFSPGGGSMWLISLPVKRVAGQNWK